MLWTGDTRPIPEQLEQYAENDFLNAAEFLAELLAYEGENHNAEKAYKWYFVAYSSQGYNTDEVFHITAEKIEVKVGSALQAKFVMKWPESEMA
jgi:hypothetical protein